MPSNNLVKFELNGKYSFKDQKSVKTVIPARYEWVDYFEEGVSLVREDNHVFWINFKGDRVGVKHYLNKDTNYFRDRDNKKLLVKRKYLDYEEKRCEWTFNTI